MRTEQFRRIAREKLDIRSDRALAAALGINPINLSKLLNHHQQPSGILIAIILDAFDEPFERLFEVRLGDDEPTALAEVA